MEQINDITNGYQRLIDMLEEELITVSSCLKGDVLNVYKTLLEEEIQRLRDQLYSIRIYR